MNVFKTEAAKILSSYPAVPQLWMHPYIADLKRQGTVGLPAEFNSTKATNSAGVELPVSEFVDSVIADVKEDQFRFDTRTFSYLPETVRDAIDTVLDYLNKKHYLIFRDRVDSKTIESVRNALKPGTKPDGSVQTDRGSWYFENSKLRINNITTCLNSMQSILDLFTNILDESTGKELIKIMGWEKFTRDARKHTQKIWKKEESGDMPSAKPENKDYPWTEIYDIFHQVTEHYKLVADGKKSGDPVVTLNGREYELKDPTIEEVFELVNKDRKYSPNNIDFKLHFLRDKVLGVIPNAQRILTCLEVIIEMKVDKSNQINNAEEIAERVQAKLDLLNERPGKQLTLDLTH